MKTTKKMTFASPKNKQKLYCFTFLLIQGLLLACSGGSGNSASSVNPPVRPLQPPAANTDANNSNAPNAAIPDNRFSDTYNILIFGNSHVRGVGNFIEDILSADDNSLTLQIETFHGEFLDDNPTQAQRLERLQSQTWSHIILQGQRYSQSGTVDYPTSATQNWISLAKAQNSTPILFPEHPQRNNTQEGRRVHNLHRSIAEQQAACIAPVGLVWDRVIELQPDLALHHLDGNHASNLGKALTAMVFYEVITGYPADQLAHVPELDITPEEQNLFGQIVSEVISEYTPCEF